MKSRNDLMLAETEVERLSDVVDERNDCVISKLSGKPVPARQQPSRLAPPASSRSPLQPPSSREPAPSAPVAQKVQADGEMPIATVVSQKAHLRTGPGKDNSPLMSVSVGTRLAVETRQGDWYRVITPRGTRAWVAGEVIKFGSDASVSALSESSPEAPPHTSKSPSPGSAAEDRAFDLLKNR